MRNPRLTNFWCYMHGSIVLSITLDADVRRDKGLVKPLYFIRYIFQRFYLLYLILLILLIKYLLQELPAHVRPMTSTHVLLLPLYLRPRFLTCSCSVSNILNYYELMYLAQSIASNQAYSRLLCRFRNSTYPYYLL